MLVVQATFGGTLLIGGLRAAGVVMGFVLSVCAVILLCLSLQLFRVFC